MEELLELTKDNKRKIIKEFRELLLKLKPILDKTPNSEY